MDLKCPDSGECDRNRWANLDRLKPTDEIKFVIASRRDWDWTAEAIREHRLDERFTVLVESACSAGAARANWPTGCWNPGCNVRMQLQMHKYIWEPNARGV